MSYSLADQFQSTFVGTQLGYAMFDHVSTVSPSARQSRPGSTEMKPGVARLGLANQERAALKHPSVNSATLLPWFETVVHHLIRQQTLTSLSSVDISKSLSGTTNGSQAQVNYPFQYLPAIVVPVTLFFHEDLTRLAAELNALASRIHLLLSVPSVPMSQDLGDCILGLGVGLALILQSSSNIQDFGTTVAESIGSATRQSSEQGDRPQIPLITGLDFVQLSLDQHQGLHKTATGLRLLAKQDHWDSRLLPILLGIYVFLDTPSQPEITLGRAQSLVQRNSPMPALEPTTDLSLVCTVAGMLSGAYNKLAGLQFRWKRGVKPIRGDRPSSENDEMSRSFPGRSTEIPTREDQEWFMLYQLSHRLFMSWAGILDPNQVPSQSTLAIQSPRTYPGQCL